MTYWDELEQQQGKFNFIELDKQLALIKRWGGTVSLCLGARQPRWPENHWPDWAWKLPKRERSAALFTFLESVVTRYKTNPEVVSYQLENEALLRKFGERPEVDRLRLHAEFELIKRLDSLRPIIMTTSTSWGIPFRRPIPDMVGFSYYQLFYSNKKQAYKTAFHTPLVHKARAFVIRLLWRRPSFIHELQLEPWGPKQIWDLSFEEQMKSMSPAQIKRNIELAKKTGLKTIDLWGGEWWYWCHLQRDESITTAVLESLVNG